MKLPARGRTIASIRAVALADLGLALTGAVALFRELRDDGFAASIETNGALSTGAATVGLVVAPVLTASWLGFGLYRLDRVAWVGQIAAGVVVPIVCALFAAVGLAVGPWASILGAIAAFFALSLWVLGRREVRWSFGIGPDAVLAEIHTRGETSVAELAERFSTRPEVVETLLAQTIARGAFLGAWDRNGGAVYSVATVLAREALRRCPRCGGAVDAVGHVARCPYCATEFAELRGLEHPIPTPIGVRILAALDRVVAYVGAFLAATWIATFLEGGVRSTGEGATLWWIFGGIPLVLAFFALSVGRRLEAGRRSGWIAQQVLLLPAMPYLLQPRVRALFSSGLSPLRDTLTQRGDLPFDELARALRVPPPRAEEIAVHLTATRTLDAVIDWQQRRLVPRDRLGVDGRERCRCCGAPLRLGGVCAFCGTSVARAGGPPAPRPPVVGWGLATFVVWAVAFTIVLAAVATRPVRPTATATVEPAPAVTSESPLDVALGPVAPGYDPARQEVGWISGGVRAFGFDARGRLYSGEQNGLFVWNERTRAWRTPEADSGLFGGVRWVGFDPSGERFFVRPHHAAVFRGRDQRIEARVDFTRLHREIHRRDGHPHLPTIAATTLDPSGRLLGLFVGRGVHLHDLTTGERLLEIPAEILAREGPFELSDATVDRSGAFVALLARDRTPGGGGLFATRSELVQVWEVATQTRRLQWKPELSSTDAVLLAHQRGRLAFAPDPRRLVTLGPNELRYWDVEGARAMRLPDVVAAGPIAFSDDGRMLAVARRSALGSPAVGVLAVEVGEGSMRSLGVVAEHDAELGALVFDRAGEVLVSGDARGAVRFTELGPFRAAGR